MRGSSKETENFL